MIEVGLSLAIFILWGYSFGRSLGMWIDYRDARSLRNALLNLVILSVSAVYVAGAYAITIDPSILEAVRWAAWVIRGELLVVGILAVLSWHPWRP